MENTPTTSWFRSAELEEARRRFWDAMAEMAILTEQMKKNNDAMEAARK